ncbi:MAG: hypothetical protein QOG28_3198, partial [Trebonia sp.]|nr:hypothetical protein [Trebonia sp.]
TVSAWTTGGNVPDATIRLQATPASGGAPGFGAGCGSADRTSSCDLGAVDAKSAPRQLQAQLTVPVTASAVRSVSLTVIGNAAHLAQAAEASATVSITAPPPSTAAPQNPAAVQDPAAVQNPAAAQDPTTPQNPANEPPVPASVTSPLPVGSLPSIPNVSPTLSPGRNAADLFPTLDPTPTTGLARSTQKARTRPVAGTSALSEGAPVLGAQLAGLAALALAFVLAVTRLTIRRRPTPTKPTPETNAAPETNAVPGTKATSETNAAPLGETPPETPVEPAEQPKANENPPADPPEAAGGTKPDA